MMSFALFVYYFTSFKNPVLVSLSIAKTGVSLLAQQKRQFSLFKPDLTVIGIQVKGHGKIFLGIARGSSGCISTPPGKVVFGFSFVHAQCAVK